MSTEDQKDSVQPDAASGQPDNSQEQKKDSVAYETYRRTVGEAKNAKEKARQLEAELEKYRQKEAEEAGNYSKVLQEKDEKISKLQTATRMYVLGSTIKEKALKHGANPQAVEDILRVENWSDVQVDDELKPDETVIEERISKLSKEKPYFFQKQVKEVKSVVIDNNQTSKKSIHEMTRDELVSAFKQLK